MPTDFALIIGAMKSGTTTLFEVLAQHPNIAASSIKEPNFFADPEVWERGVDWYRSLWSWDPERHRIALEASPAYTTFPARPGVPERIASMDARFRFIYILRNPVDQISSNVRHTLYAGWGKSLDEGIPDWMIETVRYAWQLEQYLAWFPRDRFLLLTLEEYHERPAEVLQRICGFLDIRDDFEFAAPETRYNSGDVYQMPPVWAAIAKAAPVRWLAAKVLPRSVKHRIRARLTKLPGREARLGRYRLNEREAAALHATLADEYDRLERLYDVPVRRYWLTDSSR